MYFSRSLGLVASFAALASAAPVGPDGATCGPKGGDPPPPTTVNYTLPTTGTGKSNTTPGDSLETVLIIVSLLGTELPAQPTGTKLLKIAVGHGLQNYTCANSSASAVAIGALAVLYDVTAAYPGTPGTGLPQAQWDNLTFQTFWKTDVPLNLQDKAAASPGTPSSPNALPEASYAAVVASPWIAPAPLSLPPSPPKNKRDPAPPAPPAGPAGPGSYPYLGVHYFDAAGSPTFDLTGASAFFSGAKNAGVHAPASADKGVLATGAVDWLQLKDNGKGLSKGVSFAYRVITDGGAAQACSVSGAGSGSVPYTAFYWFFASA
jgi:hypothetical protein